MIRTETSLLNLKKKHSRGLSSRDTRVTRQGPSPLRHPAHAVFFAFVCSVLEFCLQRAGVLFAACNSFVSSVLEFCLQHAGVLFAARWSFVCSVLEFCLQCAKVLFAAFSSFVCSVPEF